MKEKKREGVWLGVAIREKHVVKGKPTSMRQRSPCREKGQQQQEPRSRVWLVEGAAAKQGRHEKNSRRAGGKTELRLPMGSTDGACVRMDR